MTPAHPVVEAAQHSPATVVVAQRVKPGREDDVWHWQDAVNRAVSGFPGYLGNDVTAPARAGDWSVTYRFDTSAHLVSWLASPEREALLRRGADLFDGEASQHVLLRDDGADPVTIVVSHRVDPADEKDFLDWQKRVTDAERQFAGFRGAELFRPVPGVQDEWTALYRFDTDEHVNAWLQSPERQELLHEGRRFADFRLDRISSPFGSWFAPAGRDEGSQGPAEWKTALSVLVGLYPTVVLLTLAMSELWKKPELWASLLVGNIVSVALLTWVVMPVVTRALRFWLVPGEARHGHRLDALGALISVAFLAVAALVFWICTTQVWHLP